MVNGNIKIVSGTFLIKALLATAMIAFLWYSKYTVKIPLVHSQKLIKGRIGLPLP